MIKPLLNLVLLLCMLSTISAAFTITEVQTQGNEFVELVAQNDSSNFNFSSSKIFDSNDNSSYNTVSLVKKTNSSLSLIAGSNFLDAVSLDELNCSVYETSGTQVSKGGLLSNGEELHIYDPISSEKISWIPQKEFSYLENQSIDAIFQVPIRATPCKYNPLPTSTMDIKNMSSLLCSCPSFSLQSNAKITNDTIEYSFSSTNTSNAVVEYWIESYDGSLVKEKINTTYFTTKYFTPSSMGIYRIFAKLYAGNCVVKKQIDVMYYRSAQKSSVIQNSSILIENEDELLSNKNSQLHYTIKRGDTRKRAVKFYVGNEEFATLYVQKNSQLSGRLLLPQMSDNLLEIKGLGINKSILVGNLSTSTSNNDPVSSSSSSSSFSNTLTDQKKTSKGIEKMEITIFNITQNTSSLLFHINSTHLGDVECYIVNYRTKLSSTLETILPVGSSSQTLEIDMQKGAKLDDVSSLELFCKYKKSHLKTYSSLRVPLNLSFENNVDSSKTSSNSNDSLRESTPVYNKKTQEKINTTSSQIVSQQTSLKSYVIYIIVVVLCVIIGLFMIFRNN